MSIFTPKSIAVVGASVNAGKVGHDILKNLLTQGFKGSVYPVNPKYPAILGVKSYPSVKDIPYPIDLCVIVTPAVSVPGIAKECGEKSIPSLVVISAGFKETHTEEGGKLEEELVHIVRNYQMNLVGPNCLGILRPAIGMNASFAKTLPTHGNIALISQSGAMAVALMDASPPLHLGYSLILSIGNKTTMDESDFLAMCENDSETKVVGLYLESIKNGQRFLEIATRVRKQKPIVLLKAGTSEQGKKAAASHTGALAGSDAAIDALCAQVGVRRAKDAGEFLDLLSVLSSSPPLLSPNIAIVTNAGGPGILATDAVELAGLSLPSLSAPIEKRLKESLPSSASTSNPIDVIGDAGMARYSAALDACGDDPSIDGICVLLTPQIMTPCEDIAQCLMSWKRSHPLMPLTTSFMGEESVKKARECLLASGIPTFPTPERAIRALAALTRIHTNGYHPRDTSHFKKKRVEAARAILHGTHGLLSEECVGHLFTLYHCSLPQQAIAQSPEEAAAIAKNIGFPVIAKVSSKDIIHKTDVGGIKGNLQTIEDVERAFESITTSVSVHAPKAQRNGVLIQKFLPIGNEFIVGSLRDPSFGHLLMVGLGGIYTELFRDTSFRIAPIEEEEAYRMLQELTSWPLLLGLRGKGQSDIAALAHLLTTISILVIECPEIKELDLNPVLVDQKGVTIADAKVLVG